MNDLSVIGDRRGPLAKLSDTARTLAAASLNANTRRAYAGALKRLDTSIGERTLDDSSLAGYLASLFTEGRAPAVAGVTRAQADAASALATGDTRTLAGLRDAAIVALASDAMLRVSEIAAIDVADLTHLEDGPCVREERSTDIRRCKSPIRNWGRAEAGVLRAPRPRESGRTVLAGRRRPRSASAFADLQSIARGNRRM